MQQPVGGRRQQEAKLIGPEIAATQAVGETGCFELVDKLFRAPASDVEVVDGQRRIGPGGDDEARVGTFGERFRLVDGQRARQRRSRRA